MKRLIFFTILMLALGVNTHAQEWMKLHHHNHGNEWVAPMRIDQIEQGEFVGNKGELHTTVVCDDGGTMIVPVDLETLDSICFADNLTDEQKGHDKYQVFTLHINTLDQRSIDVKEEWIACHFMLDGKGEYSDYSGTGRIRGRGNSTWLWYDKKPYKIKLDSKSKLLGLDKAKNWNLMANYRDVSGLMNAFAFEAARCLGMPHTNHTRYVEVILNGEYIGLYQLTEKIEVGKNRVDIDEDGGVMLSFDADDGPELSPNATDNFWSSVFRLPMCVKHPENPTREMLDEIRADFAEVENAVNAKDFVRLSELVDIKSFIGILIMHELLYNVEIDAPRSLYVYRDKGGKYTFGPVWDWDAGFDFDWSNMYGHDFYADYRELMYGTSPATQKGAAYHISPFWTTMFADADFMSQYKQQWTAVSDTILTHSWGEMEQYVRHLSEGAYDRDADRWPRKITNRASGGWGGWGASKKNAVPLDEVEKMHTWLKKRIDYLNDVVANYPAGDTNTGGGGEVSDREFDSANGILRITQSLEASRGYSQTVGIIINQDEVADYLGGKPEGVWPMDNDGRFGDNTAQGAWGAWYNDTGDTSPWANGHVYIEPTDKSTSGIYDWKIGCHPDNCAVGHTHTVRMCYWRGQRQFIVQVTFVIQ